MKYEWVKGKMYPNKKNLRLFIKISMQSLLCGLYQCFVIDCDKHFFHFASDVADTAILMI